MEILNITDSQFNEVVSKHSDVLVDFWAPWCGPCKMIAPILEKVSAEKPNLCIVKLNIDENSEIAAKMGVRGIPTLALFKGGAHAASKIGAVSKDQLVTFLESHGI